MTEKEETDAKQAPRKTSIRDTAAACGNAT